MFPFSSSTDPRLASVPLLVLELWKLLFIRDLTRNPEIGNSPYDFCLISGDWSEFGIPNLAWMLLLKNYLLPQNSRFKAFTISELLKENQKGDENTPIPLHRPRLGLKKTVQNIIQNSWSVLLKKTRAFAWAFFSWMFLFSWKTIIEK